jgi:hypothetical protein
MIGYLRLLLIGGEEHFPPAVGEAGLRRWVKKLPSEYQHAMVQESLMDRLKGFVAKGMVEVDSIHLGPDRASESLDGNLRLHGHPPTFNQTL